MKIRTVDLTRIYRLGASEIVAVKKVNFEVSEKQLVAIVGPTGSGKTTLLNLIGLNDYPTSGKILIDNVDASLLSNSERRKIRLFHMGFVFQTFNLLPTLNALENVELPMALAGKSSEEQRARAVKLLESVGLGNRLYHRPKELSMGEMQRVAIARALANNPELVIADEPTGELDHETAKEIIAILSNIKNDGEKTVIVATHDEKMVEVADTVYAMRGGELKLQEKGAL
ncbi:MAG: ABC transporter ATP-binding protein [Candidatus Bathyarchaeia archaeon]